LSLIDELGELEDSTLVYFPPLFELHVVSQLPVVYK